MSDNMIEPPNVIHLVDHYIDQEVRDAERYENRTPLDDSGAWSLHQLARDIYALGVADGAEQARARAGSQRQRERNAAKEGDR